MTLKRTFRLGTRGSALALAQAELTTAALRRAYPDAAIETHVITTSGDQKLDLSLIKRSPAGAKGLFTKEIEEALLRNEIDIAVHSCKDMPGEMPDGLVLAAVLERAPTGDVLITKGTKNAPYTLDTLPRGSHIATSSVRRARQLAWARPDLQIEEIRGNVQTRLRKLMESETLTGILLAHAGLERLGYSTPGELTTEQGTFQTTLLDLFPAIGQGAIALQTRRDDAGLLAPINHLPTWRAITAERELMRLLQGDCNLPVGVRSSEPEPGQFQLEALLFDTLDSSKPPAKAAATGAASTPEKIAADVFTQLTQP